MEDYQHLVWVEEDRDAIHYRYLDKVEYYSDNAEDWVESGYTSLDELERDAASSNGVKLIRISFEAPTKELTCAKFADDMSQLGAEYTTTHTTILPNTETLAVDVKKFQGKKVMVMVIAMED